MSTDVVQVLRSLEKELRYEVFAGSTTVQRAARLAADEITRLRTLVDELMPYMLASVRAGLDVGAPTEGHVDDDCPDCLWFMDSCRMRARIDAGEFGEVRL